MPRKEPLSFILESLIEGVIAFDEGERILLVSFLPESLSRVLIVMPCDFSVWAPFWTMCHIKPRSRVLLFSWPR